jgi:uncharacterized coiled-coil protein SlyX
VFKRLYYTTALALLPSVEDVTKRFEQGVAKLDARTQHLEALLEEQAVALANNAHKSRTVRERLTVLVDELKDALDNLIESFEAAFKRRERAIIAEVSSLRAHLDKASEVRDAVARVLDK